MAELGYREVLLDGEVISVEDILEVHWEDMGKKTINEAEEITVDTTSGYFFVKPSDLDDDTLYRLDQVVMTD